MVTGIGNQGRSHEPSDDPVHTCGIGNSSVWEEFEEDEPRECLACRRACQGNSYGMRRAREAEPGLASLERDGRGRRESEDYVEEAISPHAMDGASADAQLSISENSACYNLRIDLREPDD